jgi:hypothetical protein
MNSRRAQGLISKHAVPEIIIIIISLSNVLAKEPDGKFQNEAK